MTTTIIEAAAILSKHIGKAPSFSARAVPMRESIRSPTDFVARARPGAILLSGTLNI